MNWDAIGAVGEIVGATAVIGTLIYFSIQIRSLSADSYANSLNAIEEGERDVQRLYIENAALIQKANRGEKLSDDEYFVLREVFQATWVQHLFAYLRSKAYKRDGSRQVRNLVYVLKKYPGFVQVFDGSEFQSLRGDQALELIGAVNKLREKGADT